MSCHASAIDQKVSADYRFVLVGNPNVGKSAVFNRLTGLSATTANYPGKTVEINTGIMTRSKHRYVVVDLPGTYGLDAVSEDQSIARQEIIHGDFDVIVVVVDASNLARNLYQVIQLRELRKPIILALNMVDCALRKGIRIDAARLAQLLGLPVVPTIASTGVGLRKLALAIAAAASHTTGSEQKPRPAYEEDGYSEAVAALREAILASGVAQVGNLTVQGIAIRLLEQDPEVEFVLKRGSDGTRILQLAGALREAIGLREDKPASVVFAAARHSLAQKIADEATLPRDKTQEAKELAWHYTVWLPTAIPLMFLVILGAFGFMFQVGGTLGEWLALIWGSFVSPTLQTATFLLVRNETAANILLWGVDAGILAALSVGIPYVLLFYLLLSILEDTGYLTNISFITDSVMRQLGLHGRSIIPLIMGLGCNVPAITATRALTSRRDRLLASALITLTPCSARIAVVLGAVAYLIGWQYAFTVFLVDFLVIGLIGKGLNLLLPGQPSSLLMEMAPFRMPSWDSVLKKTWLRFKAFMIMALPLVTVGSLVMGVLYESRLLAAFADFAGPALYLLLGLPPVAGIALVLGILRKELTLQLLVSMAVMQYGPSARNLLFFMSPIQLLVFALVVTLYFPCIATMGVLGKEMGWKSTFGIVGMDIAAAVAAGAIAFRFASAVL